jgi:hypothetical protein
MFVPFSELDGESRVWIYQADRKMSEKEKSVIESHLNDLCVNWNTHGAPVYCSYFVQDWFICLFVDESKNNASGCSIDSSVATIKKIEQEYNIDFFNRLNIGFMDGKDVKVLPLSKFKSVMNENHMVFNNLVKTKKEMESSWIIPIQNSWLAKYLVK